MGKQGIHTGMGGVPRLTQEQTRINIAAGVRRQCGVCGAVLSRYNSGITCRGGNCGLVALALVERVFPRVLHDVRLESCVPSPGGYIVTGTIEYGRNRVERLNGEYIPSAKPAR